MPITLYIYIYIYIKKKKLNLKTVFFSFMWIAFALIYHILAGYMLRYRLYNQFFSELTVQLKIVIATFQIVANSTYALSVNYPYNFGSFSNLVEVFSLSTYFHWVFSRGIFNNEWQRTLLQNRHSILISYQSYHFNAPSIIGNLCYPLYNCHHRHTLSL